MKQIDFLCSLINRRIKSMNFQEETQVREHLTDCIFNEVFDADWVNVSVISDILDVNEECIKSILEDFKPKTTDETR